MVHTTSLWSKARFRRINQRWCECTANASPAMFLLRDAAIAGIKDAITLRQISEEGDGVLVYMRQEGRGIGLAAKIHAYKLRSEERRVGKEAIASCENGLSTK